jgi:hypothetical protein
VPLAQHDEVIEALPADSAYFGPVSASLSVGKRMQVPGGPVTPLGWEPSASPWRRARGKSTAPFPPAERGLLPPYDAVPPDRLHIVVVPGRTPHVLCRHPPPSTPFPWPVVNKRPKIPSRLPLQSASAGCPPPWGFRLEPPNPVAPPARAYVVSPFLSPWLRRSRSSADLRITSRPMPPKNCARSAPGPDQFQELSEVREMAPLAPGEEDAGRAP